MQVKKQSALSDIVNAAREEFLVRGYRDASMRLIASAAGMSAGNIYKYFRSKRDLFLYIAEPQEERLRSMYRRLEAAESKPFTVPSGTAELSDAVYKWAAALDALYSLDTYMLLGAGEGSGYEQAQEELAERLTRGVLSLCGRSVDVKPPVRYPLDYFMLRLVCELRLTAVRYRTSGSLRSILRNQFLASVLGFVVALS